MLHDENYKRLFAYTLMVEHLLRAFVDGMRQIAERMAPAGTPVPAGGDALRRSNTRTHETAGLR